MIVVLGVSFASPHMRILKCVNASNYHDCAIITLKGFINPTDGAEFVERTKNISSARVDLAGVGGSTAAGIVIGEQIHKRGFNTFVPPDTVCASSCANISIAGKMREMGPKSLLTPLSRAMTLNTLMASATS